MKGALNKVNDTTKTSTTNSNSGSILSSIANAITGNCVSAKDKIVGTWVYQGPAVVMKGDNALKNIGGKIASSKMESTLKTKLEAYGFKAGDVTMTTKETSLKCCQSRLLKALILLKTRKSC